MKDIYKFRENYLSGGLIGFSNIKYIYNLADCLDLSWTQDKEVISNLENKIINYLKDLPEYIIYSVLPVIRWTENEGKSKSLSLTESFKIEKHSDFNLIAKNNT